jgi:hypothetical protein
LTFNVALLATCFHAGFLLGLFLDPEDGGDMFLRNVGLHSVISQKIVLFNRTSAWGKWRTDEKPPLIMFAPHHGN